MKAIETIYNGYRFRSRLEARWAVFFDALGVKYEYEPEGFDLGDGDFYLPDFRVKCWGTRGNIDEKPFDLWIEVKGKITEEDARKIRKFAYFDSVEEDIGDGYKYRHITNPILIVGNIPNVRDGWVTGTDLGSYDPMDGIEIYPLNLQLVDGDYFGTNILVSDGKLFLGGDDSSYGMSCAETEQAYDLARKARFEHGENKTVKRTPFVFADTSGVKITINALPNGCISINYPEASNLLRSKCGCEPLHGSEHAFYLVYAVGGKPLCFKYINWMAKNDLEFGNWLPFDWE